MKTIVLNSTNLNTFDSTNCEYIYKFPYSVKFEDGDKIALSSLRIYYSWRNITSALYNNSFSYIWVNGQTYQVNIPDSFMTIDQINAYLQSIMVSNKHYLVDSSGNYVYYLEIIANSTTYKIELRSYTVPVSLPSGYTAPSGFVYSTSTVKTPQFVIPNTKFTNLIGVYNGTYPTTQQSSTYVKSSDYTPQVSPISSLFITCNLVNNPYSYPSNILTCFSSNVGYGSLIEFEPRQLVFVDIQNGYYSEIRVKFVDQNFNSVNILDTNLTLLMVIRNKNDSV